MADGEIVGRDRELQAISSFLEQSAAPAALLIEGDAGIGKTTLWRWGVDHAAERGWHVLTAGPAAAEARLAFAAVGDLLAGVIQAVMSELPPPQKRALGMALLLEDGGGRALDERAVAVAVLAALRAFAGERSLVVAVDDVQWLDDPSAHVLSFVARRLGDDPIALLLAQRTDEASGVPLGLDRAFGEGLRRVRPGPLSLGASHALLRSHLGLSLPRPALHRVHAASGGNPLFALEIGRVLKERPWSAHEPLPVPHDLEQLLRRRIERLSAPGREAVLAAALLGEPTAAVVEQAADAAGLDEAMAAGVLILDRDRLRFTHPLLAEAATALTLDSRRREMHLRLAALLPDPDVVERRLRAGAVVAWPAGTGLAQEFGAGDVGPAQAQHLALGTSEPAADVAAILDRAAEVAYQRGARSTAAALTEHAARLTPHGDLDEFARRTTLAAHWWMDAGDRRRCLALIEPLVGGLPRGARRLEALHARARAVDDRRLLGTVLEDALAEADGYLEPQVVFLFMRCRAHLEAQEFDPARERAQVAVEVAERSGDPSLIVLALGMAGALHVGSGGVELLHRARDLERDIVAFDPADSPATWLGFWLLANDELDAARLLLVEQLRRAVDIGDDWSRSYLHWPLTEVECRAGNYDVARAYAEDGLELAEQSDSLWRLSTLLYCRALVSAHLGDVASGRADAEESMEKAEAIHSMLLTIRPRILLAFLAVSEGRYADARDHLRGLTDAALKGPYWATYPFWGDLFEALVALGELERAHAVLSELDVHRHVVERPGTAPVLARCLGLVLVASGAHDKGVASLEEALRLQEARPVPLERARTLLVLGEVQRRANRRRAARETLQEALASFESLGAQLWAERARKEIARIGGRAPSPGGLTPTERRVAELVAEGKTNRQVAAELVVAVRTVETVLTAVYRKLDVRGRTEMARKLTNES